MSWLDGLVVVIVGLIGVGGYVQGAIRGSVRLLGLVLIAALGAGLTLRLADQTDLERTLTGTAISLVLALIVVSVLAWMVLRRVPPALHRQRWNQWLGVLPALVQGLLVLGLLLTLVERLAPAQSTQLLVRNGAITGPLIAPFDWLEHWLITQS